MSVRVQPSQSWVPAGSLWCDQQGESRTQGFHRPLLSHCKEFSVQGLTLCLQMHHTLLLRCFPEGLTELLCLPQFSSCHAQPMAMRGCDRGSLYLERKCLQLCGSPLCPVGVIAGDGWEPEVWAGRGRKAEGNWAAVELGCPGERHKDALSIC